MSVLPEPKLFKSSLIRNQDLKDNFEIINKCFNITSDHVNKLDHKVCNKINHMEKLLHDIGEKIKKQDLQMIEILGKINEIYKIHMIK